MSEYGLWSGYVAAFVETGFPTVDKAAQALADYVRLDADNAADLEIVAIGWAPAELPTAPVSVADSDVSIPCWWCGAAAGTPCSDSECGTYDITDGGEKR